MRTLLQKLFFRGGAKIRTLFFKEINRLRFKLYGVKFGKNLNVFDRIYVKIVQGGFMSIGNNFKFTSGNGINPLCRNIRGKIFIDKNAHVCIGNNVGISSACIWAKESITIGNNVLIGGDCIIMDTDAHNLDWRVRAGLVEDVEDTVSAASAPIVIKDNVLIGTRSIILKGVTIGARSVIAAGSVVTKSIPDDCMAGGNPCKVIKTLQR